MNVAAAAGPSLDTAAAVPAPGRSGDLIYTSLRTGSSQIFRIDADGARETQLTQGQHSELQPVWSRQGRIAFTSTRSGGGDIYTMDASGGDLKQVTTRAGLDHSPAWSPDGQRLAYIGENEGRAELRVVRADGSNDQILGANLAEVASPAWSPDATKIAFIANVDGKPRIMLADLVSGSIGPATEGKGGEFGPVWVPDGRSIVYVHSGSRTEGVNLRKVQLGSTASVALTQGGYTNSQPRFSADGSKLLYLSNASSQGSTMNVHVMNADGTGVVNLTRWEHTDMGATWSADGQHVFFMSFRDWPGQIYRIGADGKALQRLTRSASQERRVGVRSCLLPQGAVTVPRMSLPSAWNSQAPSITAARARVRAVGLQGQQADRGAGEAGGKRQDLTLPPLTLPPSASSATLPPLPPLRSRSDRSFDSRVGPVSGRVNDALRTVNRALAVSLGLA